MQDKTLEDLIKYSESGVKAVINDGKVIGFITERDD